MIRLIVLTVLVMTVATAAFGQGGPEPAIAVIFDLDTQLPYLSITTAYPVTGYICAVRAEMMVGGAAFMVDTPDWLPILSETFPAGLAIGDLAGGVELGLTAPIPVFGAGLAVLADFLVFPPDYPFACISLLPHPDYATPMLADSGGVMAAVVGEEGWLTHPDPNEDVSWGSVKTLFR